MDNCIFCKIANGQIPSATIYEDLDFRVILDIAPASKGHALILPKKHYSDIFTMDEVISKKILPLATKITTAMKETLHCDGINLLQNNGEAAGQTVFHFHVHLIPRWKSDGLLPNWDKVDISNEELQEISKSIQSRI